MHPDSSVDGLHSLVSQVQVLATVREAFEVQQQRRSLHEGVQLVGHQRQSTLPFLCRNKNNRDVHHPAMSSMPPRCEVLTQEQA
mgnify:CR=1 FL=1